MLRSLLEDGEFARIFLEAEIGPKLKKFEECLEAAIAAGEAVASPVRPRLASLLFEHLVSTILTRLRPARPVVDYGVSREELIEQTVWFVLRGMGLTDKTIRRHYNPAALRLLEG
jgi:hypothetical protein